ncbi:glycoside hydrolase family 3 protein [Natrononativus amylolyticus]|uniref:glycoside hydrolase family 3 protein n=1 Tax=Natrononativus amylolyticus TaxID=2963434 RepID=UPI0020CDD200|nr:glycoside hydrolase family 3 protein [Natrononativus amylolyticus]
MVDSPAEMSELSLSEKVGQLLHVGIGLGHLETDEGWPDEEFRTVLEELKPGGVRVYGNHAVTPHFMAQYTNRIQEWAAETSHGHPVLISCDGEYGTVDITRHEAQAYPALMGRTAAGDRTLATDVSSAVARDMLAIGLNMNHQPVVDVNTNPDNPVIGVRSPGSDPETVADYAGAALEGIHAEEQIAVAKHFPGHGDTELDSHEVLPHVRYDRETLEEIHLPPFEAMIEAGVDCIMTSHIVVECLDDSQPATLSRPVLTGLLREELGFDGVVITDAMMMDAIADNYGVGEAAVRAVDAGVDLILTGFVPAADLRETRDALLEAVEEGRLSEERIDRSVERILALKERYDLAERRSVDPLAALETIGGDEGGALAVEAYERSLTLLGNDDLLPLAPDSNVLLTGIRGVHALEPHFDATFGDVVSCSLAPDHARMLDDVKPETEPDSIETQLETLRSLAGAVDVAVVTTYSREEFSEDQRRLVDGLAADLPVVVVSLGLPNEYERLPADVAYLATYLQDRLGMPAPVPDAAAAAIVSTLERDVDAVESLPIE